MKLTTGDLCRLGQLYVFLILILLFSASCNRMTFLLRRQAFLFRRPLSFFTMSEVESESAAPVKRPFEEPDGGQPEKKPKTVSMPIHCY